MVVTTSKSDTAQVAGAGKQTSSTDENEPSSPQIEGRSPIPVGHDSRTPTRFDAATPTDSVSPQEESATPKRQNLGSNSSLPTDILESLSLSLSDVRPSDEQKNPKAKNVAMKAPEPPLSPEDSSSKVAAKEVKVPTASADDPVPNSAPQPAAAAAPKPAPAPAPAPTKKPRRLSAAAMRRQAQLQVQRKGLSAEELMERQGMTNAALGATAAPAVVVPKKEEPPKLKEAPTKKEPPASALETPKMTFVSQPIIDDTKPKQSTKKEVTMKQEAKEIPAKTLSPEISPARPEEARVSRKPATLGNKKVVSSPKRPSTGSVKFLADPSTDIQKVEPQLAALAMPPLDDDEEDRKPAAKLTYKKSNSLVSWGSDDEADKKGAVVEQPKLKQKEEKVVEPPEPTKKQGRKSRSASVPNIPVTQRAAMVDEKKLMADAQQSIASLSADTLGLLMRSLADDKDKTSTNMKELIENNPPGSFIVESKPGLYHVLEPKILAKYVAANEYQPRRHSVSNATITQEQREELAAHAAAVGTTTPPTATKPAAEITIVDKKTEVDVDVDASVSEVDVDLSEQPDMDDSAVDVDDVEMDESGVTKVSRRGSVMYDV